MEDEDRTWQPPKRSTRTGHRVSDRIGYRPIETRRLGFLAALAEYPMRWLARSMATEPDNRRWHQEELDL